MTTIATNNHSPESSTPPAPARHWVGLREVAEVPTPEFLHAQAQLERVAKVRGIAAVSGRPGSGKTFSVDYFLHHNAALRTRKKVWLDAPRKPTVKAMTVLLARELGLNPKMRDPEYVIVDDLVAQLGGSDVVVVLDEAQNLSADGLQQLRYFHDRCVRARAEDPIGWTLLLVGSTVDKKLAGASELSSRVTAWVRFEPLADVELLTALRSWHPLLAEMNPKLLLQIDKQECRGNWRYWAQFLSAYIDAHDRAPAATDADRRKLAGVAIRSVNRNHR